MPAEQKKKSKFKRGFKKEAESYAFNFRKELGLCEHDYLPACGLANHLGVAILSPNDIRGLSKDCLAKLLKPNNNAWSACTIEHEDKSKYIIHNCSHSSNRQESDIMHELAHVIRGHEMTKIGQRSDIPFLLREYKVEEEEEAIWLGGCLQIPRCALVWAFRKNMSVDEISKHYNASISMVNFRVNKEGIRKQFRY